MLKAFMAISCIFTILVLGIVGLDASGVDIFQGYQNYVKQQEGMKLFVGKPYGEIRQAAMNWGKLIQSENGTELFSPKDKSEDPCLVSFTTHENIISNIKIEGGCRY